MNIYTDTPAAWKPSFWRRFPRLALGGIVIFAITAAAIGAVLRLSNGQDTASWPSAAYPVSVQVILSILVNILNLSLTVALSEGYKISWWLKALNGSHLSSLQFDLEIQKSLKGFSDPSRSFDRFAIGALIAFAVSNADGPLIQRASTTSLKVLTSSDVSVTVNVSSNTLPAGFSGWSNDASKLLQPVFANVNKAYTNGSNVDIPYSGCEEGSTCAVSMLGPGFDMTCDETQVPYNFTTVYPNIQTFGVEFQSGYQIDDTLSLVTVNFTTVYKNDASCVGSSTRKRCIMQLATVAYPVSLANGSATLHEWQLSTNETINLTRVAELGDTYDGDGSMLDGFVLIIRNLYDSYTSLGSVYQPGPPGNGLEKRAAGDLWTVNGTGLAATNYLTSDKSTYAQCNMTWGDPSPDIFRTVRELMFRSAVANAAANSSYATPQTLSATSTKTVTAYETHYEYLGVVLAITLLQLGVIGVLLNGWWRLGRSVSLNPFEISKALGAATLDNVGSNSTIDGIFKVAGGSILKYGEVDLNTMREADTSLRKSDREDKLRGIVSSYQGSHDAPEDESAGAHSDRRQLRLGDARMVQDVRPGAVYF